MDLSGSITLKRGKTHSIERGHPWIFSGAIHKIDGTISDGSWVRVLDDKGNPLATGHYQQGSIAVRILTFGAELPGKDFFEERVRQTSEVRARVNLPNERTNCFRLVHGEGDGLPGLIIDYYDGVAVVQAHAAGMHVNRNKIAEALGAVLGERLRAVYYKRHASLPGNIDDTAAGYIRGMSVVPHVVLENGNKFYVDWEEGQKTGFFLDQRDNRALLGNYVKGQRVLNTFCYTGGFSIYAIEAGAELVHSVDVSERAVDTARHNISLNNFDLHTHACYASDTFEFMKTRHDQYDVIVLDPPAFAKHRDARHQAVKGYQRLNADAMRSIRAGGIIFTFSCSQVVDRQLFYDTIVSAAIQAGRRVRVLHHLCQGADHPVSVTHPEGEYLKGLVLHVT